MTSVCETPAGGLAPSEASAATAGARSAADRFMRRLLRVSEIAPTPRSAIEAHRGFRVSLVVSAIRCLVTYLLVPIAVPIIGFAGIVSAPIGIALCVIAAVNGIYSLRRFWASDHRSRWMYTWFIAVVFLVLLAAMITDIARIVEAL